MEQDFPRVVNHAISFHLKCMKDYIKRMKECGDAIKILSELEIGQKWLLRNTHNDDAGEIVIEDMNLESGVGDMWWASLVKYSVCYKSDIKKITLGNLLPRLVEKVADAPENSAAVE